MYSLTALSSHSSLVNGRILNQVIFVDLCMNISMYILYIQSSDKAEEKIGDRINSKGKLNASGKS